MTKEWKTGRKGGRGGREGGKRRGECKKKMGFRNERKKKEVKGRRKNRRLT